MHRSWHRDMRKRSARRTQRSYASSLTEEILTQTSCTRNSHTVLLRKCFYRILLRRSQTHCARDLHTEIWRKRVYRTLMQRSWHRDLAQEIRIQRSCTSGPTRSWFRGLDTEIRARDPHTEILHKFSYWGDIDADILRKKFSYSDLAQVALEASAEEILNTLRKRSSFTDLAQEVLQDPDAKILTQRSCARDPHTEILHKWSYKILIQRSWHRDTRKRSAYWDLAQVVLLRRSWHRHLAQEILIQWSCTSGPRGSWYRHPDTDILRKRSSYSDLAQVVLLQDLGAEILKERSWTRDPLLRKESYWGDLDTDILRKRFSIHYTPILRKCFYRILLRRSARDPHTEILHKRSYRILMQTSWQRDLAQEIHVQRSCTSGPTGSWCRHHDREILHKRSADRDLAQVVLQDLGAEIRTERSCTRDPQTEILRKWYYRILVQGSVTRASCTRDPHRVIAHGPTGSCCSDPDADILHRFSYRDLAQVLLQDPAEKILTHLSCTRSSYRDFAQVLLQDPPKNPWHIHLAQQILRHRSTGSCWGDLDRDSGR